MKTASAKAKGRRLSNKIAEMIRDWFSLGTDDVVVVPSGVTGKDIILSDNAKKIFGWYAIECKNQEHINIWSAIKQAISHVGTGEVPLVIFSKNNERPYVVISWDDFLDIHESLVILQQNSIDNLLRDE